MELSLKYIASRFLTIKPRFRPKQKEIQSLNIAPKYGEVQNLNIKPKQEEIKNLDI